MSTYNTINDIYNSMINGSTILPDSNVVQVVKKVAGKQPTQPSEKKTAALREKLFNELASISKKVAEIEAAGGKIEGLLNTQMTHELSNANAYEQIAAWFDVEKSLVGFASFFMKQASDERDHAAKMIQFMKDCGLKIKIGAIEAPKDDFDSPEDAFAEALRLEKETTKAWHKIREQAVSEKNHATEVLSNWFVTEQVEELDVIGEWLDKVKMAGTNSAAILLIDSQIGK